MKDQILSINLETQTAPVIQEVRGRDYIEYGTEDWRNLYPQFLIDLYYNSSTHSAIINATAEMIAGEDIIAEESDNLDTYVRLKEFMAHVNSKESMHSLIKKVAFDFKLQGGYAIHVIWNNARTEIAELYHVPCERVRAGRANEFGVVDTYYISADWSNTRAHKPYAIPAFNVNDRTSPSQLIYTGSYSPNMDIYHTPDYLAGCNWALIDQRVAEFHLNNIQNGFAGSYFISFANGVPTQEERMQIEQSLSDKFAGSHNSGKFILTFSDDRNRVPEITPIAVSNADKQYLALQELLLTNICAAHRVTSKTLMGIDSANGFSSNADELLNASNFYQNTVIRPFQHNILQTLKSVLEVNRMALPLDFVQLKPITIQFDSKTIREVMTRDEVREDIGLEPLDDEDTVVEDEFSKTTLNTCECQKEPLQRFSDKTELEQFIEDYGEDIPEDWEMVDEEIVDGEHQDFDFEAELNQVANEKFEFVSTGRATPNTRSDQDGLNKKENAFYKVRYVYTRNNSLRQEGETRDFCRLMMASKKIYRKENILRMSNIPVNAGWGPRGAATYSIWLYKGGGNCHHYWKRRIYKADASDEGFVVYPDNITTDKIITAAKARSEGFTIKRNDSLVARAPKTMKNEGFLNPR
jgi:hypothetical protein